MATHCATELANSVSKPPMRSEIAPQICRLKNPAPRRRESIAAPCVAEMPTSVHSATKCACGIDIVTQQRKAAKASSANTTFGGQPNTGDALLAAAPAAVGSSGGGRK